MVAIDGYEPKNQDIRDRLKMGPYVVERYITTVWSDGTVDREACE